MIQYSTKSRNARLDLTFSHENCNLFRIFTGPPPETCDHLSTGEMLLEVAVYGEFFHPAVDGVKVGAGSLAGIAVSSGKTGYFRGYDKNGECSMQGGAGHPAYAPVIRFEKNDLVAGEIAIIKRLQIIISP